MPAGLRAQRPGEAPAPARPARALRRAPPVVRLPDRDPLVLPGGRLPAPVARALRSPGPGAPLAPALLRRLSEGLGADLRALRVHADGPAAAAARALGARAFAFGRRVFLGPGQRADDVPLLAHEAAHALQQTDAAVPQLSAAVPAAAPSVLEREARAAGAAVAAGGTHRVVGRVAEGTLQHDDEEPGVVARTAMALVRRAAPWLVPVIERGPVAWLADHVTDALRSLADTVLAPVRAGMEVVHTAQEHVGRLGRWAGEAVAGLARGDCTALAQGARAAQAVVEGLVAPAVDRIKHAAARVAAVLGGLRERFGAPAWSWLRGTAGAAWAAIERLATRLWDATQPVRDWLGRAWTWLKGRLGIAGDSPGGLLDWVRQKAEAAWGAIRQRLAPYARHLAVAGAVLVALSPAGPLLAAGAVGAGLVAAVRFLARHVTTPLGLLRRRGTFAGLVVPRVRAASAALGAIVARAAAWLTGRLAGVTAALGGAAGAAPFAFLASGIGWLLGRFEALRAWATTAVGGLAARLDQGLARLGAVVERLGRVLARAGRVLEDITEIAALVAERAWNALPACVRDPIAAVLVEHVLRRIPVLADVLRLPGAWARIAATARAVVRRVLRGLQLREAALELLRLVLDALQVPVALVRSIWARGTAVLRQVVTAPGRFVRHLVGALRDGVRGFLGNAARHLLGGVVDWLTGQLPRGVAAPVPLTAASVLRFVLDVLGLTMQRVWAIVARVAPAPVLAGLRAAGTVLGAAWEWIALAVREGPAGLWRRLADRLGELRSELLSGLVRFLVEHVVTRGVARLAAMLNPAGAVLGAVVAAWQTIQTVVEHLRRLLGLVDGFLQTAGSIAAGAVAPAAARLEQLLAGAVPVAVGWLANVLGLSGLGERVRAVVGRLQGWVERAIEGLVRRALAFGGAVVGRVRAAMTTRGGVLPALTFFARGQRHTLDFRPPGFTPTVSSTPNPVVRFVRDNALPTTDVPAAERLVLSIGGKVRRLDAAPPPSPSAADRLRREIAAEQVALAAIIRPIFERMDVGDERFRLEGLAATYNALRFPGDRMDADHQPQHAALAHIASMRAVTPGGHESTRRLFADTRLERTSGLSARSVEAHAILLARKRHAAGRTYGRSAPADAALARARAAVRLHPGDEPRQRRAALEVLRAELQEDARQITRAVEAKADHELWGDVDLPRQQRERMVAAVRRQIHAGEQQMLRQPLEAYLDLLS